MRIINTGTRRVKYIVQTNASSMIANKSHYKRINSLT